MAIWNLRCLSKENSKRRCGPKVFTLCYTLTHTAGHLAGDGVMVFFNAPITVDNPQAKAVQMALEIRQELSALWNKNHYTDLELDFGTGIASGDTDRF